MIVYVCIIVDVPVLYCILYTGIYQVQLYTVPPPRAAAECTRVYMSFRIDGLPPPRSTPRAHNLRHTPPHNLALGGAWNSALAQPRPNQVSPHPTLRVAICGHGRVGALWATGEKFMKYLVRPLHADLFVLALAGDSPCPPPYCHYQPAREGGMQQLKQCEDTCRHLTFPLWI